MPGGARRRGGSAERALEALDAGHERARRRVDLGRGGLHERELELGAGVGAVLDRAQRGGQQVEQPHDVAAADARGLLGEALVALGRHAQLGGHLAQRLDDEQLARVGLEVAWRTA